MGAKMATAESKLEVGEPNQNLEFASKLSYAEWKSTYWPEFKSYYTADEREDMDLRRKSSFEQLAVTSTTLQSLLERITTGQLIGVPPAITLHHDAVRYERWPASAIDHLLRADLTFADHRRSSDLATMFQRLQFETVRVPPLVCWEYADRWILLTDAATTVNMATAYWIKFGRKIPVVRLALDREPEQSRNPHAKEMAALRRGPIVSVTRNILSDSCTKQMKAELDALNLRRGILLGQGEYGEVYALCKKRAKKEKISSCTTTIRIGRAGPFDDHIKKIEVNARKMYEHIFATAPQTCPKLIKAFECDDDERGHFEFAIAERMEQTLEYCIGDSKTLRAEDLRLIVSALYDLGHIAGVVHGDLNTGNIMTNKDTSRWVTAPQEGKYGERNRFPAKDAIRRHTWVMHGSTQFQFGNLESFKVDADDEDKRQSLLQVLYEELRDLNLLSFYKLCKYRNFMVLDDRGAKSEITPEMCRLQSQGRLLTSFDQLMAMYDDATPAETTEEEEEEEEEEDEDFNFESA